MAGSDLDLFPTDTNRMAHMDHDHNHHHTMAPPTTSGHNHSGGGNGGGHDGNHGHMGMVSFAASHCCMLC